MECLGLTLLAVERFSFPGYWPLTRPVSARALLKLLALSDGCVLTDSDLGT
jgi:hypothetical protein